MSELPLQFSDFSRLEIDRLPSPCFVIDEVVIERNLRILRQVEQATGAKVLQALKAFSLWALAPLSSRYLSGVCASGLHEAQLGREHYAGELHVYAPAYGQRELDDLLKIADHIVFNSCEQLLRFAERCREAQLLRPGLRFGLRINPEHSEVEVPLYDPCAADSRLGVSRVELDQYLERDDFRQAYGLLSGLHFHALCENDFPPLARTLAAVEERFADLLADLEWLNIGGGHHITHPGYQVEALQDCLNRLAKQYSLQLYLEPGEAVAIGSGVLLTSVLDIRQTEPKQVILDSSATCHMPDTLEMPYRAAIHGELTGVEEHNSSGEQARQSGTEVYRYRLGGPSCLAGDVMGEYRFAEPLQLGQRLLFADMAHYTMVKTTTFNGVPLPAIAIWNSSSGELKLVREFTYADFKSRLS